MDRSHANHKNTIGTLISVVIFVLALLTYIIVVSFPGGKGTLTVRCDGEECVGVISIKHQISVLPPPEATLYNGNKLIVRYDIWWGKIEGIPQRLVFTSIDPVNPETGKKAKSLSQVKKIEIVEPSGFKAIFPIDRSALQRDGPGKWARFTF